MTDNLCFSFFAGNPNYKIKSPHVCSFSRYLDHEVFTEAPARLGAFLSERTHVVFKAAQVLGEGHEEESSQLEQQGIPGFLRPRRVLQRI